MNKEHDIFMTILDNPDASLENIIANGYTSDNTSLYSKDDYKTDDWVKQVFTKPDGTFNDEAYDNYYNLAMSYYNNLSSMTYNEAVKNQVKYHRDNIFVSPEQREENVPQFKQITMSNPNEQIYGLVSFGKVEQPKYSIKELAQQHQVLLNPTTAGDNLENAQWGDSPNDNFWGYFDDTLVLAQYDDDVLDPKTGEVLHQKGEYKLNDKGQYYYEKLDGRSVYGRNVLNKTDVLTTDGSFWNKIDPFDADDIEQKSLGGQLMRYGALVGSMFIPGVGEYVIGAGIATQLVGLFGTLGKMISGSDNPTFSALEGWSKSMNPSEARTQYGEQHPWCMENWVNLIGDVTSQLVQQRWLFTDVPAWFKGVNVTNKEAMAAKQASLLSKYKDIANTKIRNLSGDAKSISELNKLTSDLYRLAESATAREMQLYTKQYRKLGEAIGLGYMTATVVGDTYGEAKLAGASDRDATMLTLGYAAAEFALLKSGVGEWIFPELRGNKYKYQAITKALTQLNKESSDLMKSLNGSKELKKAYFNKLFNIGKNVANGEYVALSRGAKRMMAAGAGEGIEEVSEELLADFSKGCYNVSRWLNGGDPIMQSFGYDPESGKFNGQDVFNRYAMSLIGGFIGGGIASAKIDYQAMNSLKNMSPEQAMQELVTIINDGEKDQFLKTASKMVIGDKNKSFTKFTEKDGQILFGQGTEEDNQDLYAKKVLYKTVDIVDNILKAEGVKLSKDDLLDIQTLHDLRFSALKNSTTAGLYAQEYRDLCGKLVSLTNDINLKLINVQDENNDGIISDVESRINKLSQEDQSYIRGKQAEIEKVRSRLKDLSTGASAGEFINTALFELTTDISNISFPIYAEYIAGKKYSEISENDRAKIFEKYKDWKTGEGRDKIRDLSNIFRGILEQASTTIKESTDLYKQISSKVQWLDQFARNYIPETFNTDENTWLAYVQNNFGNNIDIEQDINFSAVDKQKLQQLYNEQEKIKQDNSLDQEEKQQKLIELNQQARNIVYSNVYKELTDTFNDIHNQKFVNNETRKVLNNIIGRTINFYQDKVNNAQNAKESDEYFGIFTNLITLQKELNKLPNTPFQENINQFSIATKGEPMNVQQIIEQLDTTLNATRDDIRKFTIDDNLYQNLLNAIDTTEVYLQAIKAFKGQYNSPRDYFGFSVTLNEVSKKLNLTDPELAVVDNETADVFIEDIQSWLKKLKFYRQLFLINQGQKISKQDRVSANLSKILYKKFNFVFDNNDELKKLNGYNDMMNVVAGMEIHNKLIQEQTNTVKDEDIEKFEKEKLDFGDAIYNFIQANKDNIGQIISKFSLFEPQLNLLNEETDRISDLSFLWWLASKSAIKSSILYSKYKEILDPDGSIVPIPTQEQLVFNNVAGILNHEIYSKFYNSIRQSMVDQWNKLTIDQRKQFLQKFNLTKSDVDFCSSDEFVPYILNILPTPKYDHIIFTEGIAGSGKTTAVFKNTIDVLKQANIQHILDRVAIVHGTNIDGANKLKSNLGIETAETYDKQSLMKRIDSEYKEQEVDENGNYILNDKDYELQQDKNIKIGDNYAVEIRSSKKTNIDQNPPTLILIDEVSQFSAYELDQLNNYAKNHNIQILAAGDFDQSTTRGEQEIEINNRKFNFDIENIRENFINIFKLGIPMRTNNSVKTLNQQKLLALLLNKEQDVTLNFYETENDLYGDKVVDAIEEDYIKQEIDKLISKLNDGEKIGYIYSDKNSEIYKYLNENYPDKVDFKPNRSSMGFESRYYIIEAPDLKTYNDLRDLYTGVTRSEQGSLIISSDTNKIKSKRVNTLIKEDLNIATKKLYTKKRKDLLNKVATSTEALQYIPESGQGTVTIIPKGKVQTLGLKEGTEDKPEKDNKNPVIDNVRKSEEYEDEVTFDSITPNKPKARIRIKNNVYNIDMLLHTFNSFEIGGLIDNNGQFVQQGTNRIDSVNGLIKLEKDSNTRTLQEYIQILGQLRGVIYNTKDKSELIKKLQDILKIYNFDVDNIYCTFAYKSTAKYRNKNILTPENSPFYKNPNEQTLFNFSLNGSDWNEKQLVLIISSKGQNKLELPLAILSSPFTIAQSGELNNKNFPEINKFIIDFRKNNPNESVVTLAKRIIEEFGSDAKYKNLINLFRLYLDTQNKIVYIKDPKFTIAQLENFGPRFENHKGYFHIQDQYRYSTSQDWKQAYDYETDSESSSSNPSDYYIELSRFADNPQVKLTRVLTSLDNTVGGVSSFKKGNSFVLISYDPSLDTEDKIIEQFIKQEADSKVEKKVIRMYVIPPKTTFDDYINRLHSILNHETTRPDIGDMFTSYRLLDVLIGDGESSNKFIEAMEKTLRKEVSDRVIQTIKRLRKIENSVELRNALIAQEDWQDIKIYSGRTPIDGLLDGVLVRMIYKKDINTNRETELKDNRTLIQNILKEKGVEIYYNPKVVRNANPIKGLYPIMQDYNVDNKPSYTIDGHPCMIHGKVDSFVLRGDMSQIVDDFINNDDDTELYMQGDSQLQEINMNPYEDYIYTQTGKKITVHDNLISKAEAVAEINKSGGFLSFVNGDDIFSTNQSAQQYFTGHVILYNVNSTPEESNILDLNQIEEDINGVKQFMVRSGENEYIAEFNTRENTLQIKKVSINSTQLSISLQESEFDSYMKELRNLIDSHLNSDENPDYEELSKVQTYQEFIEFINNDEVNDFGFSSGIQYGGRENELRKIQPDNELQGRVIQDLINIEEFKNPDKKQDTCSLTISLSV